MAWLLVPLAGYCQPYQITGSIADTLNHNMLHRASVTIIRASDTVIATHTRSAADGTFRAQVSRSGKYIVRISFPSFADYEDVLTVNRNTDMGTIALLTKTHLLQEFVLKRQISAIKIKGDTTEYMADSFMVKENATVEDLLKKLPGIQVDKNGQITAQGETVQKVLVDGEEFFSDDPKVVTKGLQASTVERVQVFDKKSEQAEFSGIDDGEKTKTINLQLKEDRKKGVFGKVDAGGGTDGYYQNQAMVNAFKGKRKLALFGIMSNTDKIGLGWQDNDKFGWAKGTTEINESGGITTYWNNDDEDLSGWDGRYFGQGLPTTRTGGGHFSNKWNQDRYHTGINYRYANQSLNIEEHKIVQNSTNGDSVYVNTEDKRQQSQSERHGVDALLEWKADSGTTLRLTATGGRRITATQTAYETGAKLLTAGNEYNQFTNTRTVDGYYTADFVNASLLLKHKFAKKGRTLSVDVKENYKASATDGSLRSLIMPGGGAAPGAVNQLKINEGNTVAFSANGTYTEPLSKKVFLELEGASAINNNTAANFTYNNLPGGSGYSDAPNDTFSSHYRYNIFTNSGGSSVRMVLGKVNLSAGGSVSNARFRQTDLLHGDTSATYDFVNFFPKARFKYSISNRNSLDFSYRGSTNQPAITQVQPLRQNADPTNIAVGNPNLKQEFNHSMDMNYRNYKVLTNRYFSIGLNMNVLDNAISTSREIANGISTTQFVNVAGNYNGWGYMHYGGKVKKLNMNLSGGMSANISHGKNFLNRRANTSDNHSVSFNGNIYYEKEEKFEFGISPRATYNVNKSSINALSTDYWTSNSECYLNVTLPKKIEVGTDLEVNLRQNNAVFTGNNNVYKWNAFIKKKFLKNSQLVVSATVFDILNQNLGFTREGDGTVVTQNSYNTIRRYGMLNVVWNFTSTPKGAGAED